MTDDPPRVAARKARKAREGGRLAAVSLVLGTVATVLGKMADIKKALFELLGPEPTRAKLTVGCRARHAAATSTPIPA